MNRRKYEQTPLRRMEQTPVVTLVELRNQMVTVPAGTVMRVSAKQRGLHLQGEPCEHCGVTAVMGKVEPKLVEFQKDLVHRPGREKSCPLAVENALTATAERPANCPLCGAAGPRPE